MDAASGADITAMMARLPISALEPNVVASIGGLVDDSQTNCNAKVCITFLEPPAGQRMPYLNPESALLALLMAQGFGKDEAFSKAASVVAQVKATIDERRWVCYFDYFNPESPDCLSVPDFLAWLRDAKLGRPEQIDYLDKVAGITAATSIFRGPDNQNQQEPWAIYSLPDVPPPQSMIEFVPGAPWADIENWPERADWTAENNPFFRWREAIRPAALKLEAALGEPVYYFADLKSEFDDDAVHRFLVLHWCATYQPESRYVKFLQKICGASNVESLKNALIDPRNFTQPFKMNDAFIGLEASCCNFDIRKHHRSTL